MKARYLIPFLALSCNAVQQTAVDKTLQAIDKSLLVMECNSAVLRNTNASIQELCPVPAERTTCPAMIQILADLAVELDHCKEGL
jgi:hypothetical protein